MTRLSRLVGVIGVLLSLLIGGGLSAVHGASVSGQYSLLTSVPTQIVYSYYGTSTKDVTIRVYNDGDGKLVLRMWNDHHWVQMTDSIPAGVYSTYTFTVGRNYKLQLVGSNFTGSSMTGTVTLNFPTSSLLPATGSPWGVTSSSSLTLVIPNKPFNYLAVENWSYSPGTVDVMINGTRFGGLKPGCFRVFDSVGILFADVVLVSGPSACGIYEVR